MRIIHLTPEDPEYRGYMAELEAEPLRTQWWDDAESKVEPGVSYMMVLIEDQPAAWAGWYVSYSGPATELRCCNNYVRRGYRNRSPELYELAYRRRHRDVVQALGLPAVTYLFPEPIALHEADGWVRDTDAGSSGASRPRPDGELHHWQRLRWTP